MSKATTEGLSRLAQQRGQELSSSLQTLSRLQTQLPTAESVARDTSVRFSKTQTTDLALNGEINLFTSMNLLFTKYSESKGVTVNPSIVLTQAISAEELVSTDIIKEVLTKNDEPLFDLLISKKIDFNKQVDNKTIFQLVLESGNSSFINNG